MDRPENTLKRVDYKTKTIAFQERLINIVYENDNGSCPLLALCNSLLLVGDLRLDLEPSACTVSDERLIKLLCGYYMTKANLKGSKTRKWATKTLKRLAQPIHCNMMLTSVEHMETNEEVKLFEQLGIKVYHGNVVDPMDEELVRAIGTDTYDSLLAGLFAHKAKTDDHSHSPGSLRVDESATSHSEVVNWDLIDGFFKKNPTQLTAYGFQSLKDHLIEKHIPVCALFWNHHFHVVLQIRGTLFLLQNKSYQFDTTIVLRFFDDFNGDGLFVNSKFLPPQIALGATLKLSIENINSHICRYDVDPDGSWRKQMQGSVYVAKSVDFRGRQRFIIYPYMTGSCALVALCNAILLRGDVELRQMFDCNLVLNLPHIVQVIVRACKTSSTTMGPKELSVALACLHQPVHVNINFTDIYNIKITKELEIFENLGFRLCHGFIADPEDLNLCNAIGSEYYDVTTESPTSHLEAEDYRKLVDDFLKEHDTELTSYGLRSLQEKLCETDLCVVFWNKEFHTAIKCNNRIFVWDPNLSSFNAGKIWRTLDSVDGAGATLASIPYPISGKSGKHKCNRPKCLLAFTSSFNLERHAYVHPTSSTSKDFDILKHRDEISNCWDSLSSKEAGEILSLKDMKFKDLSGSVIVRILEQRSSEGGKVAMTLLDIMSLSMKGEKITSQVLFAILDEASEKTLLCSDIRNCNDERICDSMICDIISDMNLLLACYSYLIEKALVDKLLEHKAALAFQVGEDLIAEEKRLVEKKVGVQNIQGKLHISARSPGDHSSNSTSQHDGLHLEGTGEVASDNRVQDSQSLEHTEDDNIGNLYDLVLEFFKRFRNHSPKKFYRGTVEAIKYMDDLDMHVHFPHIEEYSAELAAYIIDHYDCDEVKADISRAAAQYLIEHNIGKTEKDIHEGINVVIVDLPSPTSNMSFKKYARINKLIRPFKLPKKFRRLFVRHRKEDYIMTYAGRRAARGFMNFIIEMHKRRLSWRGQWNLSHMRVKDGLFVIDTDALYTADVNAMAEDFKRYFELLKPSYVRDAVDACPAYLEILQTDTMGIPDPSKEPEAFASFHKYLSAHFAFMPPVSICQFLSLLYNICDGLRPKTGKEYPLLSMRFGHNGAGWISRVIGAFLFNNVFFFSKNGLLVNKYTNTYWHLLQFVRHFSSHILSLTKNDGGQDIQDLILIHLMLASRLDVYLTLLVRRIVFCTNMQGLFFRAWEAFLASDDKTEEDDSLEDLEVSESQDESDAVLEEMLSDKIKEEDISKDLDVFESVDEK